MADSATFARAVDCAFDRASSLPESFARSGSFVLRLSFGSQEVARAFLPSFVPSSAGRADLAVAFLMASQCDLSFLVPQPPSDYRLFIDDDYYVLWQPGERPVLSIMEAHSSRAVIWLGADAAPPWVLSRPALPIMHAVTLKTPWLGTHGGAVGRDGRMLLLAGKGRSGKTTASLACARSGWDYAGDDYVFAHTASGQIEPLYSSARLRIDMAKAFTDLVQSSVELSEDDGELRHELRLGQVLDARCFKGGALAAILLPRRRGSQHIEFSPARPSDAFAALMSVTTMQLPGRPKLVAEKLGALVDLAPIYFVDTGDDPSAIPQAFDRFLDEL